MAWQFARQCAGFTFLQVCMCVLWYGVVYKEIPQGAAWRAWWVWARAGVAGRGLWGWQRAGLGSK